MKGRKKIILALLLTVFMLTGCSTQAKNKEDIKDEQKTQEKNTLYQSNLTEKEKFYLQNEPSRKVPFEISFDQNYTAVTCKLYTLEKNAWNNIQQFDLELSGDTFWFLAASDLTQASIQFKNANPLKDKLPMVDQGGRPFDKALPAFDMHGTLSHYDAIDKTKVEENQELPLIAQRIWKDMNASLQADTADFAHPEDLSLKDQEAYYMLTLTFKAA